MCPLIINEEGTTFAHSAWDLTMYDIYWQKKLNDAMETTYLCRKCQQSKWKYKVCKPDI